MRVEDVLESKGRAVFTIAGHRPLGDAIRDLVERNIGSLVVLDARGKPEGIVTERDVLRESYLHPSDFQTLPISDIMGAPLLTAEPEDDIAKIQALMTERRVRHVPILARGELVGLVSIGDVNKVLQLEREAENESLRAYIVGSY